MRLLRCRTAVAVDCHVDAPYLKVGVLLVKDGADEGPATLYDADTEATYPVLLPPAGSYYAVLLEMPDATTV
jgi:hypothetical protein